jgi:hypothetical protein
VVHLKREVNRLSPFEHSHFFAKLEGTDSDLDEIFLLFGFSRNCQNQNLKLSRPSVLKICVSKIYSFEADIKTVNGRNFFILKDIDVIF